MPSVSVIVPIFNVDCFIERCIESIMIQSFSDYELILVDDGSTDNSGIICDKYAKLDNRIIVIHKMNGGVSSARNTGLSIASGRYIAFVDGDDYIEKNYLFTLVREITEKSCDLLCLGAIIEFSPSDHIVRKQSAFDRCIISNQDRTDFIVNDILFQNIRWDVWAKIFCSDIIKNHNIRFCETCENYAEDLCFILEYSLYCNTISALNITGYYYVQHEMSITHNEARLNRFNSMNEVSNQFCSRIMSSSSFRNLISLIPVIHYLIMRIQLNNLFSIKIHSENSEISHCFDNIKNNDWNLSQLRLLPNRKEILLHYLGKDGMLTAIYLSQYLLDKNYPLFWIKCNLLLSSRRQAILKKLQKTIHHVFYK